MNKLEEILGISFPPGIEISSATNSTQKIRKNSIFFALPGSQNHGSVYIEKALELDPNSGNNYMTLASLQELNWDFEASAKNLEKALII